MRIVKARGSLAMSASERDPLFLIWAGARQGALVIVNPSTGTKGGTDVSPLSILVYYLLGTSTCLEESVTTSNYGCTMYLRIIHP